MLKYISAAIAINFVNSAPIELCDLSREWGDKAYEDKNRCNIVDLDLKADFFTMSGFSSGGYMTANLMGMYNENIDGVAVNAGFGPCATMGFGCVKSEKHIIKYPTDGIKGKPMFFYSGKQDNVIPHHLPVQAAKWYESMGAKVQRRWIGDFLHIFPNSVPSNTKYNPPQTCGSHDPRWSSAQNCGYNMASEILEHLYGMEELKRNFDY